MATRLAATTHHAVRGRIGEGGADRPSGTSKENLRTRCAFIRRDRLSHVDQRTLTSADAKFLMETGLEETVPVLSGAEDKPSPIRTVAGRRPVPDRVIPRLEMPRREPRTTNLKYFRHVDVL
jgi:hypothetical protein